MLVLKDFMQELRKLPYEGKYLLIGFQDIINDHFYFNKTL